MTVPSAEFHAVADKEYSRNSGATQQQSAAGVSTTVKGAIVLGGAQGSLAVARSLGRKGIPVWFVGNDHPIARLSRYTSRSLKWPGAGHPDAVDFLCDLAGKEGVEGWVIFPAADAELQLVSRNLPRLSKHFRLFTQPWELLEIVNDKAQLYRRAGELGVAAPRSYEGMTLADAEAIVFPVVIKPRSNEKQNALTRDKVWRADDPAGFERRWNDASALMGQDEFVVQEMVPGDGTTQFSYAGLWADGEEVSALTVRRLRQFPADFGTSPFVETMEIPEISVAARQVLGSINFHGLVEMDFKFDARDNSYKVLDVNTRVWAWIGLGSASGHDFPWLAWQLATTGQVTAPQATQPARWVYSSHNMLSILQQFRRQPWLDATAWRSLFLPAISATFAWDDPLPGLAEFPILVQRLFKRLRAARG